MQYLAIAIALVGCNSSSETPQIIHVASTPVVLENGNRLDSTMSDSELLQNLGLDFKEFTPKRTQGKDGYSMEYRHGKQQVTVTRSLVTGISILAEGPSVSGQWSLGGDGA
jgi:hypothetical protein